MMTAARSLALCLLLYQTVKATIWYVNVASTSPTQAGTEVNPCKSIACAVALVQSDDSIYVYPGTYRAQDGNEQICVSSMCAATGVSLLGQGSPSSIEIVGNGTNARFMSIVDGAFATIANLTITSFTYTETLTINDLVAGPPYPTGGSITVKTSNVSFSHVVFRNNSAISGGALGISSKSIVDIASCLFEYNSADIRGGAVSSDLSTLSIKGSTFVGNGAYGYSSYIEIDGNGGALFFLGTNENRLIMNTTNFYNNSAIRCGGGVYIDSFSENQISVDTFGLTFRNNYADGSGTCANSATCSIRGGAMYISSLSAVIANSSFYDNGAYVAENQLASGGAVYSVMNTNIGTYLSSNYSLRIIHSNFERNYADSMGGAFYSSHQRMEMEHCTFSENIVGSESIYFDDHQTAGGAIWFTAESSSSYISHSTFSENVVYGGWGGAIFATDCFFFRLDSLTFVANQAVSSYSYGGQGGAIMLSGSSNVSIISSDFYNNSALPQPLLSPQMLSGSGGAISIQTAILLLKECYFEQNIALTGQFDSGSSGGAILIEHSSDAFVDDCQFIENGAAGYLGFSTYSSSGTGGAILSKFSSLSISGSTFTKNWVTVGGTQLSSGAAVALFSTYTGAVTPIAISDTTFQSNTAFGDVCLTSGPKAGQGGAVSIVGAMAPGVRFQNAIFSDNIALSAKQTGIPSFGGAISLSLVSLVEATNCSFMRNIALNGLGNDITVLPIFGSSVGSNMTVKASTFESATTAHDIKARVVIAALSEHLCSFVSSKSSAIIPTNSRRLMLSTGRTASGLVFDDKNLYEKVSAAPHSKLAAHYSDLRSKYECEEEKEAAANSASSATDNASYRRRLSLFSKFDLVLDPSVMIAAGSVYFRNPTFDQNYNIFVGNLLTLLGLEDVSGYTIPACAAYLYGDIAQERLVLIGYKASVTLAMANTKQIALKGLHLINATLYVSNNVSISGNSTLSSSNIASLASVYSTRILPFVISRNITTVPSLNFLGKVYTGLGFENSLGLVGLNDDSVEKNLWPTREMTFDSCTINIHSSFRVSSPVFQPKSTDTSNFLLRLKSKAEINILPGASLYITTGTTVQADSNSDPAISNSGYVYLTGFSVVVSSLISTSKTFDASGLALTDDISVYSALDVNGGFVQTPTGSIHLTIGNVGANYSMMKIYSNESILGSVDINLAAGTDLSLYGDIPSNWAFVAYKKVQRNAGGQAKVNAPTGLGFGGVYERNVTTGLWNEYLVIQNIGCSQLSSYYSQNSLCGYCNMNSSCSFCSTGICVDNGQCESQGSSAADNCCAKDCLHGECQGEAESGFICECNFFYAGSNCTILSSGALAIIIVSVFLFTLFSVTFYVQNYFIKGQKSLVLEELRQGLLQSEDGAYSSDNKVIQSLQQELILKDVFVNFKEIKLEGKIGEGSFGVVFKASFRGAQVAVKKMRSPIYMELTQHDIEEFRKEAYTMSRLRHPNIVLVMGISLVDRDPVKPHPDMESPRAKKDSITAAGATLYKTSNKTVCIITEYLGQGSLADILYGPQRLPAEVWTYELILTCALQAARGMIYLHSHQPPICHRDLKSSNLVVDDHWVVKVTDFGMSRIVPEKLQDLDKGIGPIPTKVEDKVKVEEAIDYYFERDSLYNRAGGSDSSSVRKSFASASMGNSETGVHSALIDEALSSANLEMTSNLGTTAWCAPELLAVSNKTKYSVKVDVYSFGMVLWELWEKKRPFDELHSRFDIMDAIRSGRRPAISPNCPPAYAGLIQRCWATDPVRRPMFKYIVKYLKDELANVKRRGATPGGSSLPPGLFSSASFSEWNPMSRFESSASPLTSSDAPTSAVGALMNWVGVRSRSNTMTSDAKDGSDNRNSIDKVYPNKSPLLTEQLIPEGRKSLVAFERSLSYLAQSPAMGTPNNPSYFTSVMQQNTSSASAAQSSNPNTWRDRYVMKFSGWKATQPDVGLPPNKQPGSARVDTFTLPPRLSAGAALPVAASNPSKASSNSQILEDSSGIFAIDNERGSSPIDEQRSSMVYNAIHVQSGQSSARNSDNSKTDGDEQQGPSKGADILL